MLHWQFGVEQQQLHKYQLGIHNNHSRLMPVFSQWQSINSFDDRFLISFILIKLQKMFNKMNHRIFLGKLNAIGFSSKTITWFKSYLPDQIFWVKINNYLSELSKMPCGVQQGLNFDLLLFLSYVNVTYVCKIPVASKKSNNLHTNLKINALT